MTTERELINRIGSEIVYLLNNGKGVAVKIVPLHQKWFAKTRGGDEFEIHCSTELACETLSIAHRISKYDYESY